MLRVAILDPNEASRDSLRTLLVSIDFVVLIGVASRYSYFSDVVREAHPELVIISLDADPQQALQTVSQLTAEYPLLPIVTVSRDHQALLQSLQCGARYFLMYPVSLENLLAALRRASYELNGEAPAGTNGRTGEGSMIAVLGTRGGVGSTSVAVNLAATLRAERQLPTALIDLDLTLGDADITLEVDSANNFSIADLARDIDNLDLNLLKRTLAVHNDSKIFVLRHPLEIQDTGSIHEQHIERIINLLRIEHNFLVVDLSKSLLPTDWMALRMANVILLVAQLELASLRNTVRLLHLFRHQEGWAEKVYVIINRFGADTVEEGISLKKAEEVIGTSIFWRLPYDPKTMLGARIAGQPLICHAPKSRLQQAYSGLVRALSGGDQPPQSQTRSSKSFLSLFHRGG